MKLTAAIGCALAVVMLSSVTNSTRDVEDTVPSLAKETKRQILSVIKTKEKVALSPREFDCLAKNVYHEAGIEPKEGKLAVAQVTLNRVNDGRWGNDVCKVVYAKAQFSWTLDKKKRWSQPKGELWNDSVYAVKEFQQGIRVREVGESTFYHATYIKQPNWAKVFEVTTKVGKHIFYKI